jgi:hypothetical protein
VIGENDRIQGVQCEILTFGINHRKHISLSNAYGVDA